MIQVKNKQVVREIARITYFANRKRNMLSIFAMILTTFMISVVAGLGVSYWNTVSELKLRTEGMDYDVELTEPTKEQVKKVISMERVRYAGVSVKCILVLGSGEQLLNNTKLFWQDQTCWEKQTVPALEEHIGSYPQKADEVMLSEHLLRVMGIEKPQLGMKIPMRYIVMWEELDEEEAEADESGDAETGNFVLSGWFHDYTGENKGYISKDFYEKTGVKQTDYNQGSLKITFKNRIYSEKQLLVMQDAIGLGSNQLLLGNEEILEKFVKMLFILAVIFLMICASGYLFIYNTMYISVSKDIQYYGQLKTIGMTSKQLWSIVRFQVLLNSVIAIPLGLAAAAAVMGQIIPRVLALFDQTLDEYSIVQAKGWIYLLAGGFSLFTNIISGWKPIRMAAGCSPVEAVTYVNGNIRARHKKSKRCFLCSMALQNMFRDKMQATVIFLSFLIGISIFLTANVFVYENDAKHILNETWNKDIRFLNQTTLEEEQPVFTPEKISQIRKIPGVKAVRPVSSAEIYVPYQENVFGDFYRALYQTRYAPGNYEQDIKEYKANPKKSSLFGTGLIGVDKTEFQYLNNRLGNTVDPEAFERGEVAIATKMLTEGDNHITGKTVHFFLPDGPETEYTIRIAAVDTDGTNNPAFFSRGWTPDLIVSQSFAEKLLGELYVELINVEYEETYSKETEERVKVALMDENKKISHDSKLETYLDMGDSESKAKVLGYSIAIIIAMLVLLNYINMMVAMVLRRSKEFAALESIGMTRRQMKRMLNLEGAGYGLISIIGALPLGIPFSYLVFENTKQYYISFAIPWERTLLLFIGVIVICVTVPIVIYRTLYRQSIIEQLKFGSE